MNQNQSENYNKKNVIAINNIIVNQKYERNYKTFLYTLSQRIAEERARLDCTLDAFAIICNLDRKTLYRLENMNFALMYEEVPDVRLQTIIKIATASKSGLETFVDRELLSPEIRACMDIFEPLEQSDRLACINMLQRYANNKNTGVYVKKNRTNNEIDKYVFGNGDKDYKAKLLERVDNFTDEERLLNNAKICYKEHKRVNSNWKHGRATTYQEDFTGNVDIIYEDDKHFHYEVSKDNKITWTKIS